MDITDCGMETSAMVEAVRSLSPRQLASVLDHAAEINSVLSKPGNTALHAASILGNRLLCQLLIERGSYLNAENANGQSPLHFASLNGNVDVVCYLISMNAHVNKRDKDGRTSLHMAAKCSSKDNSRIIVELLLDAGAEISYDFRNRSVLYYIWRNKNESLMYLLLEKGAGDIVDSYGNTYLHYAVEKHAGNKRLVQNLLNNGASINKQNNFGLTPLLVAAQFNYGCDCINFLLENRADVNIEDWEGETAIVYAIRYNNHNDIKQLINKGANINSKDCCGNAGLHISVTKNDESLLNVLLEAGADVNEVNNGGNTALHLTVFFSNKNMLKRLLGTEINVDLQNNAGMTAFHIALYGNKLDIAHLLLERTSRTNMRDIHGQMLIHKAVTTKSTDLLQKLITIGANLLEKNNQRLTALHLAAMHSYDVGIHMFLANEIKEISRECSGRALLVAILRRDKSALKKLLENDGDVNLKDSTGKTALHWAVLRKFSSGVVLLLRKGINANEQDIFGNTALHLAVLISNEDILRNLLSSGADVNLQDEDERTALHFAANCLCRNFNTNCFCCLCTAMLVEAGGLLDLKDCDGNTALMLAVKNNKSFVLRTLLIWGAGTYFINNFGQSFWCFLSRSDFHCSEVFWKHFTSLTVAGLETYNLGLNSRLFASYFRDLNYDMEMEENCAKELREMIDLKIGRFCLYDVLTLENSTFVFDNELKSAIFSTSVKEKFPNYWMMLRAKFCKSEIQYRQLNESVRLPMTATTSNGTGVHLPNEVKLMIFSLLSVEDLVSVIRAT